MYGEDNLDESVYDDEYRRDLASDYLKKAYVCQQEGDIITAITFYKKALSFNPTALTYSFIGWAYSFLGDYNNAIAYCEEGIKLDPEVGNNWNDIGAYLIQQKKLEDAQPYIEMAKTCSKYTTPHFPFYNQGKIYELKGWWMEAVTEYKKCLDLCPDYEQGRYAYYRMVSLLN